MISHFYEDIYGYSLYSAQGMLLEHLLDILKNKRLTIAEIGVYKGRMTAMWNVELINRNVDYEYYAIDHFLGSDGILDASYDNALLNLKTIENRIKLIQNDSISESEKYEDEFFDIVYIDASHDYESVKKDLIHWYPKVKTGGIICGDDYSSRWKGVIEAVDEFFTSPVGFILHQWFYKKI